MSRREIIDWLLEGDVSIQYQVQRDLLHCNQPQLRKSIEHTGWGRHFLSCRKSSGHWGLGFYQPKWTCSHYTLLDLKNLGISRDCITIRETLETILQTKKGNDGGVNPGGKSTPSDVCVSGMALNYLAYFRSPEHALMSITDFLISQHMRDGGFNCRSNREGARHSSLHSTLSVLEGILEYRRNGYTYRIKELETAATAAHKFILLHRLFRSDHTGAVIDQKMLRLSYPCRWRYDILRALDYFRIAGVAYDPAMADALNELTARRKKDGRWHLQANHPGQLHFHMETAGLPSRWNTLRALRVLDYFGWD